jgi:hypothetical protein
VHLVEEAAGIVFGGGRTIFHVQRGLEAAAAVGNPAMLLCDRGTPDPAAYWPEPEMPWAELGTMHAAELARCDVVIHLRTPAGSNGFRVNPRSAHVFSSRVMISTSLSPLARKPPCRAFRRFKARSCSS